MEISCKCGCGKTRPIHSPNGHGKRLYYIRGHHMRGNKWSAGRNLNKHPNWKGGRYITNTGYVRVALGEKKTELEHVLVMEKYLGRKLLNHELVHHIDGNKQNNDIENLQLMSRSEHTRIHTIERWNRTRNLNN